MAVVLRPNIKKVLIIKLVKNLIFMIISTILLVLLQISRPFGNFFLWLILLLLGLIILSFFFRFISLRGRVYSFRTDSIVVTRRPLQIFKTSKSIHYPQISKVSFLFGGFFNKLFRTGTIILDLRRVGGKDLKLEYVDNPKKAVAQIKELIRLYRVKEQTKYTEKYKLKDVLDKSGL